MAVERKRGFAAEWRRLAYETWIARHWSLDQALQYSLDKTRLGYGIVGIHSGAELLFGVPLSQLDTDEAAVLACFVTRPQLCDPVCQPIRALQMAAPTRVVQFGPSVLRLRALHCPQLAQ